MTQPKKIESIAEAKQIVDETSRKIYEVIREAVSPYEEEAHFVLAGRIINTLILKLYGPVINWGNAKKAEELK